MIMKSNTELTFYLWPCKQQGSIIYAYSFMEPSTMNVSRRTKLKFCDAKRLSLPLLQIWKCIFSCILVNDKQKFFFGLSTVTRETLKVTSRFIINPTKSCYCIYQLCSITTLMDFAHKPFHKKDIDTYYIWYTAWCF